MRLALAQSDTYVSPHAGEIFVVRDYMVGVRMLNSEIQILPIPSIQYQQYASI